MFLGCGFDFCFCYVEGECGGVEFCVYCVLDDGIVDDYGWVGFVVVEYFDCVLEVEGMGRLVDCFVWCFCGCGVG